MGDDRSMRSPALPPPTPPRPSAREHELAPAPEGSSAPHSGRAAVLVVGAEEPFVASLRRALLPHEIELEAAPIDGALESAIVTAPDLILLVGEATLESGRGVLSALASSPVSSVVPVALLADDLALADRLREFRHGAAAVIAPAASLDDIAQQVAELAREIPARGGASLGSVGGATLEEVVRTLGGELRSGILSLSQGFAGAGAPVRLVLGGGRPGSAFLTDDFVQRAQPNAAPMHYEFDDRAGGTVQLLSRESQPPKSPGSILGLRLILVDDEPVRADSIARELRARGAELVVSDLEPDDGDFARLRQMDPQVVVIGEPHLQGAGYALLQRMKRDTRLRWTSLLVVRWSELWDTTLSVANAERLTGALALLAESDRGLSDRAELGDAFDVRLEVMGPARCLRALGSLNQSLRLTVFNARVLVDIDLSDKLVVGAQAVSRSGPERWEGAAALSAFLVLSSGRVHVTPVRQPKSTNLMAPVEVALSMGDSEPSPISTSMPAAAAASETIAAVDPQAWASPAVAQAPLGDMALAAAVASTLPPAVSAAPARSGAPSSGKRGKTQRARRISVRVAALLVALAAVMGLIIAVALRALVGHRAESASVPAPAQLAEPVANAPLVAPATGAATSAPAALMPSSAPPEAPAVTSAAESAATFKDESGARVATCDELLADSNLEGEHPSALQREVKAARAALTQGHLEAAQRAYCKAVRLDPTSAKHYFDLTNVLLLRRDGVAAVHWGSKGVQLDPTSTRGQALLGDALARAGDAEGARKAWQAAAGLTAPTSTEIEAMAQQNLHQADGAAEARDYFRAERFFRRSALLTPENLQANLGLSTALLRQGQAPAAAHWARRAVALAPEDPVARLALGDALLQANDTEAAKQEFLQADRMGHLGAKRRLYKLDLP